ARGAGRAKVWSSGVASRCGTWSGDHDCILVAGVDAPGLDNEIGGRQQAIHQCTIVLATELGADRLSGVEADHAESGHRHAQLALRHEVHLDAMLWPRPHGTM